MDYEVCNSVSAEAWYLILNKLRSETNSIDTLSLWSFLSLVRSLIGHCGLYNQAHVLFGLFVLVLGLWIGARVIFDTVGLIPNMSLMVVVTIVQSSGRSDMQYILGIRYHSMKNMCTHTYFSLC